MSTNRWKTIKSSR
ncbi:Hypothetical protein, putative [Bodo saltans]|uniref:Uncharacterized protein n=1 Tax=Bodo saltans TaxID=75058 RepID=A0A0S4J9D3_BODSA|nr:Hypothetical protein, putative [Bodo saltans]|eukprot:CUG86734.1 Hypothetical protein, putative [Bodo saltans]